MTVRGMITHVESRPTRGRAAPVKCILNDGTGQIVLVWFNQPWIAKKLRETTGEIIAYGLVKDGGHACEIHSPEWEVIDPDEEADGFTRIVPVYGLTESLMQRSVRRVVSQAINSYADLLEETLPVSIRKAQGLPGVGWAVRRMHQPESPEDIAQARHRIAFDEFLAIQLMVQMRRAATQQEPGIKFEWGGIGDINYTSAKLAGGLKVVGS